MKRALNPTTSTKLRRAAAALATTAVLAGGLVACSDGDDAGGHSEHSGSSQSSGDEAVESSGDFNDADVTFAQQMIPHHEQATEMAGLAEGRTQNPEVLALAEQIAAAQEPEIETMQGWLEDWGAEEVDHTAMDHGGMDGMMSEEDMAALEAASGAEFDEAFLTMMIEHHQGAVEMARTEEQEGQNPDAVALASQIVADQTAEISTMQELLDS
jgi:uncharacterized protein (DUF305 family)